MTLGTSIVDAALQSEGSAALRNPILKLVLVCVPLLLVFQEIAARYGFGLDLQPAQVIAILFGVTVAARACVEESCRNRFAASAGAYFVVALFLVLVLRGETDSFEAIADWLEAGYHQIPMLRVMSPRSWLIVVSLVIAVHAVRNIQSRDALWLGRTFLWGWTFRAYMIAVVTHAVVHSVLFSELDEAWSVARSRYFLLANPGGSSNGMRERLAAGFRHFLSVLGRSVENVGDVVYALMHERRFFAPTYRDTHATHFGVADVMAAVIVGGAVLVALSMDYLRALAVSELLRPLVQAMGMYIPDVLGRVK